MGPKSASSLDRFHHCLGQSQKIILNASEGAADTAIFLIDRATYWWVGSRRTEGVDRHLKAPGHALGSPVWLREKEFGEKVTRRRGCPCESAHNPEGVCHMQIKAGVLRQPYAQHARS
jgi:hypothetical protein